MAIKLKTPSMSLVQNAFWVAVILAAARFLLSRFGGEPGARVLNYL